MTLELLVGLMCAVLSFFVMDLSSFLFKKYKAKDDAELVYVERMSLIVLPLVVVALLFAASSFTIESLRFLIKGGR